MTATEIMERSSDMARILGATYGRLQTELLTPLIDRGLSILRRRGELPPILIDGRTVDIDYKSPLARRQGQEDVGTAMGWFQALDVLGPEAYSIIDAPRAARWLAKQFSVPEDLLLNEEEAEIRMAESRALGSGRGKAPDLAKLQQALLQQAPSERATIQPSQAASPLMNPDRRKITASHLDKKPGGQPLNPFIGAKE